MKGQEEIREKSLHIKNLVSGFTKQSFVCFFADFMLNHSIRGNTSFSEKLKSKYRDSLYLIALRLSSKAKGKRKLCFSPKNNLILEEVADILNDILLIYLQQKFSPDYLQNPFQKNQRFIHETTFRNYFQNGKLNYHEQEINHVIRMFKPYDTKIAKRLGIGLESILKICNRLQDLFHDKRSKALSFLETSEFQILASELTTRNVSGENLPNKFKRLPPAFFEFANNPHLSLLFTKEEIEKADQQEIEIFLSLFAINVEDEMNILFYTQPNPLEEKPILKFNDGRFLHVYQKQIPTAIYKLLYRTLGETPRELDKLNSRRGKKVFEEHVENIFYSFFKKEKKFKFFRNYYINGSKNEKDLLIISKYYAFIVECKSSRFREPLRDTEKAFRRIKEDFSGCIQNGFEQCLEVEENIMASYEIAISDTKGTRISKLKTKHVVEVFKIIVTLERFGPIQTDLGLLLNINDEEHSYPWAVYVDDLEVFLLALRSSKASSLRKLIKYLCYRDFFHGRILTQDELDLCALFLQNQERFRELAESDIYLVPDPALQNYFDDLYFTGKLNFKVLQIR